MIVLDCSAAVAIARRTPEGAALRALIVPGETVLAPSLIHAEAANVFARYQRAGCCDAKTAQDYADAALLLVDRFVDDATLRREALAEAIRLGHSAYDLFYLVLARRNAATLFTLDKALRSLCKQAGVEVIEEMSL